jgi:ribosomal protein S18 acetylase RimI-like enzyme
VRAGGGSATARPSLILAAPAIEIARCAEADLPHVVGLALRAFAGASRRLVVETLFDDAVFVAREGGRPVGYIAVAPGNASLHVDQLVLAAGYERETTGAGLVAEAERYGVAERVPALRVRVGEADWAERSFYRRLGFDVVAGELLERALPAA